MFLATIKIRIECPRVPLFFCRSFLSPLEVAAIFFVKGGKSVEKLEVASLNTLAYNSIKQQIMENHLQPGQRLEVGILAEALGVSKTPVRNALKALEQDGYVTIRQRSGSFVRTYNRDEVTAIFRFRLALEKEAALWAVPQLDPNRLQQLKVGLLTLKERFLHDRANRQEMERFFRLETELHLLPSSYCPAIITHVMQNLVDLSSRLRKLNQENLVRELGPMGFFDWELKLHLDLLEAMEQRDVEKTLQMLEKDILTACCQLLESMRRQEQETQEGGAG